VDEVKLVDIQQAAGRKGDNEQFAKGPGPKITVPGDPENERGQNAPCRQHRYEGHGREQKRRRAARILPILEIVPIVGDGHPEVSEAACHAAYTCARARMP